MERPPRYGGRAAGLLAGALAVALLAAGLVGYEVGRHQSAVTFVQGTVHSSGMQADAQVNGWTYDIPFDVQSWTAPDGSLTDGSTPSCLRKPGDRPISFGYVTATVDGTTWRPVVWVRCE